MPTIEELKKILAELEAEKKGQNPCLLIYGPGRFQRHQRQHTDPLNIHSSQFPFNCLCGSSQIWAVGDIIS